MSLYRYFAPRRKPYLLDPEEEKTKSDASETKEVERTLKATASSSRSRKRKNTNSYYDPKTCAKIGRFAAENGNKRAVEKFSQELQRPLSESTVHGFKKAYFSELSKVKEPDMVQELAHGARGKPTTLGDLDKKVQAYIGKLRAPLTIPSL